jgi:hypothetical protein
LHNAGPEALWVEVNRLLTLRPGMREQMFSESLARNFGRAREYLHRQQIEILHAPPDGPDLIIGDVPVVLMKEGHDGRGPHEGLPLDHAEQIVMPISANTALAFGPQPGEADLPESAVHRLNMLQFGAFINWIAFKPGGPNEDAMREHVPSTVRQVGRR